MYAGSGCPEILLRNEQGEGNMKPFRAIYQRHGIYGSREGEPEEVLVVEILPSLGDEAATVVFLHSDGRLDQDRIHKFGNCRIPWV